jgi:prevent-host-death family protein
VPVVSANDLRTKGVSEIERVLQDEEEVVISVRGKPRYVVMDIAHYDFLRECEIAAAWAQTREDLASGRYQQEDAEGHVARIIGQTA